MCLKLDARGARSLLPGQTRAARAHFKQIGRLQRAPCAQSMVALCLPVEQLMCLKLDARGARSLQASRTRAARAYLKQVGRAHFKRVRRARRAPSAQSSFASFTPIEQKVGFRMDARGARALQPSRMRVATLPAHSMSAPVLPFEQLMFLMLDARGARALFAGHTRASRAQCTINVSFILTNGLAAEG